MRDSENRQYTREWLQVERPQPMFDSDMTKMYDEFYQINPIHNPNLDQDFRDAFVIWLAGHTRSKFEGWEVFPRRDIINGCTQFIDDLYQRCGDIQTFENDYKYHWRLNNDIKYVTIDTLDPNKELLIAMPFPSIGDVHPDMPAILNRCAELHIPVHVDGAWIGCIRDITFNFNHPAIKTFGISLSKGGLGGNRIGMRFARETPEGAITIMNDFAMNSQALMSLGIKFMQEMGPEYFWNKYEKEYFKICEDFNLIPSKAIHIAMFNNSPVGVRSLLRALKSQH